MTRRLTMENLNDPVINYASNDATLLRLDQTVQEALAGMRSKPPRGRIIYFYVLDKNDRLVGVVPTRRLLLSDPSTKVQEIAVTGTITIPDSATVLEACEFFTLHRFLAMPVVDKQGRFKGVVDIELYTDEIVDLAERTSYDDLFQLVGVSAASLERASSFRAFGLRFPWLVCNIVGGILAAFLSGFFQDVIDKIIVLALFIPVVLALSESVAIQSVSLTIQSLHGVQIQFRKAIASLRRELLTGLLLGIACGIAVGSVAWIWKGNPAVGLSLAAAISGSVALSAVVGVSIPLALRLIHFDPKVAAGPVALVAADLMTLTIYFNLSRWVLL